MSEMHYDPMVSEMKFDARWLLNRLKENVTWGKYNDAYKNNTEFTEIITDEQSILHKFEQIKENIDLGLKILSHNNLEKKYQHDIIRQKLFVKNNLLPVIGSHHSLWESTYQEINSKVLFYPSITTREKIVFMLAYLGLYPLYKK